MSSDQYRRDLARKRADRIAAEKKASEFASKETEKRSKAAAARAVATRTSNATTAKSNLREAETAEKDAASAGKDAAKWRDTAGRRANEESAIQEKLSKAEQNETAKVERDRKRESDLAQKRATAQRTALERQLAETRAELGRVVRGLRPALPEKLRILLLGAGSEGDLRIGREQTRIRAAVQSALHRDLVELDVRPAATTDDLLDGLAQFRPHVVHFSGHSADDLIVFEEDRDEPHRGQVVTAKAFARAISATDEPPLLVLLNSCNSAPQLEALVAIVPFAIGMADSIDDGDAIAYAARFYANVANGQSISAAHEAAQAAMELAGLSGVELPVLEEAPDVDARAAFLVRPPA